MGIKLPFLSLGCHTNSASRILVGHNYEMPGLHVGPARCSAGDPDGILDDRLGDFSGGIVSNGPPRSHRVKERRGALFHLRVRVGTGPVGYERVLCHEFDFHGRPVLKSFLLNIPNLQVKVIVVVVERWVLFQREG